MIHDNTKVKITKIDNHWYITNDNNEIIHNVGFDEIKPFYRHVAPVSINGKWGFITDDLEYVTPIQYDYASTFNCNSQRDGYYAIVGNNGKYNYIDFSGKLLSKVWLDECNYRMGGLFKIKFNNKYNYLNSKGQLISDIWFNDCKFFKQGFAAVAVKDGWYYINRKGDAINLGMFDYCDDFAHKVALVKKAGTFNYITNKGRLLLDNDLSSKLKGHTRFRKTAAGTFALAKTEDGRSVKIFTDGSIETT